MFAFAGANYFDNTSQKEKEDDVVQPNGQHVYYWEVTPEVSPQEHDPTCLTYTYVSHIDVVEDYNSGLIGTLLVCKSGKQQRLSSFKSQSIVCGCVFAIVLGAFQAAWMLPGSRWTSTRSTCSSLGFLTRTRASTSQTAMATM